MVELARRTSLPLIATNDMHYLDRDDAGAHDVLLCIGTNKKRADLERMRFFGPEFYMKTPQEMAAIFSQVPEAIENTLKINEMVDLKLKFPGPLLPDYEVPAGFASPDEYLRHLTREGLKRRYANLTDEMTRRAEYELDVIIKMKFTGYFLIVWDFIDWAKNRGIPVGPGRGSGAGSIVAYALRITDIDPLRYELLFERFLNPERISMPDFDVDFCFERRGEVINYVTQKYGADRTGQILTFGTLKAKAVIKDVARALDIPFDESNNIAKLVPEDPKMTLSKALDQEPKLRELAAQERYRELFEIAAKLENKNRHTSFHAAGIVIGKTELTDYVPLFKDPKTGIVSTQFTMDLLEDCGLVKMDFLGLKTLTLIKNTIDLVRRRGIEIAEDGIPENDAKTFALLGEGKSTSVFQFESSGMQAILKQAKPTSIEDLIALNALYRPGPMENIPQFIDSKWGRQPISYPHPSLEKYLKETYGVIVYQEQVMQVAQEVAGYSLGRADLLRRAMSKKKKDVIEKEEDTFVEGAVARGYTKEKAREIFEILVPFAGYGFNKSHAAAYSVVAYRTAYLKANYPAEFMAANLTNEIADTDKLTAYISEARSMGLEILPPDVNRSEAYFSVVEGKIVYGLLGIKGVGEALAKAVVEERTKRGPYASFIDFVERLGTQTMNRKSLECLAMTGCFDGLDRRAEPGGTRRSLVLEIERAIDYAAGKEAAGRYGQASLFDGSGEEEYPPFQPQSAEEYPRAEILRIEKELLGFYFSGHPMDEWRKVWERSCDLDLGHADRAGPDRLYTLVAMLKEWREIVTKTGRKMAFGAVEDYRGIGRDRRLRGCPRALSRPLRARQRPVPQGEDGPVARKAVVQGGGLRRPRIAQGALLEGSACQAARRHFGGGGSLRPARRYPGQAWFVQCVLSRALRRRRGNREGPCPDHLLRLGALPRAHPRAAGRDGSLAGLMGGDTNLASTANSRAFSLSGGRRRDRRARTRSVLPTSRSSGPPRVRAGARESRRSCPRPWRRRDRSAPSCRRKVSRGLRNQARRRAWRRVRARV